VGTSDHKLLCKFRGMTRKDGVPEVAPDQAVGPPPRQNYDGTFTAEISGKFSLQRPARMPNGSAALERISPNSRPPSAATGDRRLTARPDVA
jgi:hypothetical protein